MKLQTKKHLLVHNPCITHAKMAPVGPQAKMLPDANNSVVHKQACYLTQKCGTHQIRIRIARGHFQGQIFAMLPFRKSSFSVSHERLEQVC